MTKEQIAYSAAVALHVRFLAVSLMTADQADQEELASLYLEMSTAIANPGTRYRATPEDVQELLRQVAIGYSLKWATSKKGNPVRKSPFSPASAVRDLENTSWLLYLLEGRLEDDGYRARAERYLYLRKRVLLEPLDPVTPEQVDDFLQAFEARVLELACEIERAAGNNVVDLDRFRQRRHATAPGATRKARPGE